MNYLYLDIETIPTQSDEVRTEIASTITPPASMKKAETIATWEAEQKPQAVADAIAKTSFSGAHGHVVCIGWAVNNKHPKWLHAETIKDERALLENFTFNVREKILGPFTIVGHNVVNFDIRFLWQRAMVLGVCMAGILPRDPKPWSNDVHDTMTMWAGQRDTISLDNLCKALGGHGKGDIDGSDISRLWAEGAHMAIGRYCMDDVERTRFVHQKMLVATEITALEAAE